MLPGTVDWWLRRPDGSGVLDVRVTLRTDDETLIYLSYRGVQRIPSSVRERLIRGEIVDPADYYFRTTPVFETADERYAWLNDVVAIGVGELTSDGVAYTIYRVL